MTILTHPMAKAKWRYSQHKANAKFRKIKFNFTFDEWYNWWLSNGVDKNNPDETFSKSDKNRLCMCRKNDTGPYSVDNVYCATHIENVLDSHNNGKHTNYQKNYRWGNELIDIRTLKQRTNQNVYLFKKENYKASKYSEARRLQNEFRSKFGPISKRKEYHWNGVWYDSLNEAAKAASISPGRYQSKWALGDSGFDMRISPNIKEYIEDHTIFPDPLIPNDY